MLRQHNRVLIPLNDSLEKHSVHVTKALKLNKMQKTGSTTQQLLIQIRENFHKYYRNQI